MAESEGLDLSRVVGLIMENPKLIEEISALAKGTNTSEGEKIPQNEELSVEQRDDVHPTKVNTYTDVRPNKNKRGELLGAMKPYLSKERARAIDSMLTIVDVLDMMRER